MHYTADAEAIVIGANRLAQRKEPNKLMIVLSDGKPEGTFKGDGRWYLRKVCKMIEDSDMNLIGIGVKTSVVKDFYSNCEVVRDIRELEKVLIEALKRNLI